MSDRESVRETIREIILNESPDVKIEDEEDYLSAFSDLGIDSLDLMMAMLKVGEVYGIEIKEEQFNEIGSIQDIIELVESTAANIH